MLGYSAEIDKIQKFCKQKKIPLIEDNVKQLVQPLMENNLGHYQILEFSVLILEKQLLLVKVGVF